ncbi:predicted protein [Sclerotinia sclerotiorum 1980 UF-70]|uniref:Uncharacterized protein n=1 Tax=Sclerotinia sclerotiorum (strain ATCC 18683 / 1980 / Ss-1) TaxID=665079 RepID=A7ERV9_SCLS1|nr:predicted protein [Sclerotinia sclerotiorum 1980 UF-70]EDN92201.1 predicted protein [Sclerotinia sclerotiorum 1980 UF-70]
MDLHNPLTTKRYEKDESNEEEADDDMQSLITTIEILIQAGPRYENIAKKLGLGSLFLLGDTVSISVWERWLPKKGPLFEQAMSYLKDKGIIDLGEKYEEVANKILNHFEDILPKSARVWVSQEIAGQKSSKRKLNYQLNRNNKRNRNHNTRNSLDDSGDRTETEPAAPDHTAEFPDQFGVDDPATSNYNSISIDALLNTTEATTADGQSEIWNNRGESNGFASQTHDLHGKQRYVDLSFSQSKNGVTHGQGGAIGNSPLGDPDISAVPQTEGARQPIHAIEEHTIDGRIQTTNEQRKIEFVYSDPKEEKINSNLQEPFRSPVMARFQSGLGNHQQCIVVMFPRGWNQDVTFSITVDRGAGYEIIRMLDLQCLPQVQSPQGQVEQYSNMPKASLHLLGDLQQATIRTGSYKSAPGPRCACVSAFTSDGTNDDFTFSIMVDRDSGWELISVFGLKKIETGF